MYAYSCTLNIEETTTMETQPKIMFGHLKGFPDISDDDRIKTSQFLDAAREILSLIENFGKIFAPVVYDINGNIEKLSKAYLENENALEYLDDLLKENASNPHYARSREALLWLNRALQMLEQFFTNMLNDTKCEENLKNHIKAAYSVTLKQYHSWIIQEAFSVIYRLLPYRSTLVGLGSINDENMKCLETFLQPMRSNLQHIHSMLTKLK